MPQAIVDIKNCTFSRDGNPVLRDIHFAIFPTDFIALIGPNGGGKSTLAKLILGLIEPESGKISVFGKTAKKGRVNIGYLSQYHALDLHYPITVIEVVLMGSLIRSAFVFYTSKDYEKACEMLKKTNTLHLKDRRISALSGGERQRVLLARALMTEPKLLILDEPTTGIDAHSEKCFYELLEELNKDIAILMVSHDISAVSKSAKTIACLNQTLVYHGDKELLPKEIESAYCCPVDLIAHGVPHRVLKDHSHD